MKLLPTLQPDRGGSASESHHPGADPHQIGRGDPRPGR